MKHRAHSASTAVTSITSSRDNDYLMSQRGDRSVLIATPNLCLDRTQLVPELVLGGVMRARSVEVTAGGKGVNIARVARAHHQRATVVGLFADRDRERLLRLLAEEGADVVDVPMPGDTPH